jgi:hypothetical protein
MGLKDSEARREELEVKPGLGFKALRPLSFQQTRTTPIQVPRQLQ